MKIAIAVMLTILVCMKASLGWTTEAREHDDADRVREAVVRQGAPDLRPACRNYARREPYCLAVNGAEEPSATLMGYLRDIRSQVIAGGECTAYVGRRQTVDPLITLGRIYWRGDAEALVRVDIHCECTIMCVKRQKRDWRVAERCDIPSGLGCGVASCIWPGDCVPW